MNKRTPSPWIIKGQDIIGNETNGYICSWSGRSANAKLIAAAPELLEALKELLQPNNVLTKKGIVMAAKAIAKAEEEE